MVLVGPCVFVYFCVHVFVWSALVLLSRVAQRLNNSSFRACKCRQFSDDLSLPLSFSLSRVVGIPCIVLYYLPYLPSHFMPLTLYRPTHTLSFLLQSSRINDQRSPDPRTLVSRKSTMPSEDFFNLIQHLQSTRIEDQRSPLPVLAN